MTIPSAPRQAELMEFIRSYVRAHGYSPSVDEMMLALGAESKSLVARLLDKLEHHGFIRRMPRRARGIALCADQDNHRPSCNCHTCAEARFAALARVVGALHHRPPAALLPVLHGLRPLKFPVRSQADLPAGAR